MKDNQSENRTKNPIPFPEYRHWMHERCDVPRFSLKQKFKWWAKQPDLVIAIEAVLSRIIVWSGAFRGIRKYVTYKLIMGVFRLYFKIFNRLKAYGKENIPKDGCIFYVNHPGSYDPPIMFSIIPHIQSGAFVAWGNSWFADIINKCYNMSAFRYKGVHYVVEDIVRKILTKNRYFAIWPEGHPHPGPIEQGFSSIVRVYATINHDKDRLPWVPVLIRGEGTLRYGVQHKMGPIEVHFMKPFFIPRDWLKKPKDGGKTPREIIDFLMLKLARKNGQKKLAKNPRLEAKKRYHKIKGSVQSFIKQLPSFSPELHEKCDICSQLPKKFSKHSKRVKEIPDLLLKMEDVIEDPTGIHKLKLCKQCGTAYNIASRNGKNSLTLIKDSGRLRHTIIHVIFSHNGTIPDSRIKN